jgi:hypothetical protein
MTAGETASSHLQQHIGVEILLMLGLKGVECRACRIQRGRVRSHVLIGVHGEKVRGTGSITGGDGARGREEGSKTGLVAIVFGDKVRRTGFRSGIHGDIGVVRGWFGMRAMVRSRLDHTNNILIDIGRE